MERRVVVRWMLASGLAAAAVFAGGFIVLGSLRPGYDPTSQFVSELSIGPDGWQQDALFLLAGVLVAIFASGILAQRRALSGARVAAWVLLVLAAGLVGSAFFVTDPSTLFTPVTAHGRVHALLGATVFVCMPVGCFTMARAVGRASAPGLRAASIAAGVLLLVGIVVLKVSELPTGGLFAWKGLVQRGELLVFFAWLARVSLWWVRASARRDGPAR